MSIPSNNGEMFGIKIEDKKSNRNILLQRNNIFFIKLK